MFGKAAGGDRFNWRLPLYAVVGDFILFMPSAFFVPDMSLLAYLFAVLIVSLTLIAFLVKEAIARRTRRCLSVLSMLVVVWAVSAVLAANQGAIRNVARWLVWSQDYKAKVLSEPTPPNGELRHTEWDGWGWGGQDTTVYLVFDPTDSLSAAARNHESGKFRGIPCEIYVVRRLERHWYAAYYYTNELWGRCN